MLPEIPLTRRNGCSAHICRIWPSGNEPPLHSVWSALLKTLKEISFEENSSTQRPAALFLISLCHCDKELFATITLYMWGNCWEIFCINNKYIVCVKDEFITEIDFFLRLFDKIFIYLLVNFAFIMSYKYLITPVNRLPTTETDNREQLVTVASRPYYISSLVHLIQL